MFMFRNKTTTVSTSTGLQKEAKSFQEAVAEINSNYKPANIDIALIEGVAGKHGVDPKVVADAFSTYLKNNALNAIRRTKAQGGFSSYELEQAALAYGFDLDDLNVTPLSEE